LLGRRILQGKRGKVKYAKGRSRTLGDTRRDIGKKGGELANVVCFKALSLRTRERFKSHYKGKDKNSRTLVTKAQKGLVREA